MKLRAFIVEDEPPARARLRELLESLADVDVVGEADGSPETLPALRQQQPDVVFIDLHLPTLDGFSLIRQARLDPAPAVVVVTAHPERAAEAFDEQVTDYVVKPCRPARLRSALERARQWLATRDRNTPPHAPESADASGHLVRLVIRNEQHLDVVRVDQIDWIAAAGNYAVIHAARETHILRESLTSLEGKLNPARFMRVSRSALVSIDCIKSVATTPDGSASITLNNGTQLPLTRGVRELQARLERG
ncbi:MAG TPA: LytTR family DNA-binding domain-containing protein [Opitutaceae bacterium]